MRVAPITSSRGACVVALSLAVVLAGCAESGNPQSSEADGASGGSSDQGSGGDDAPSGGGGSGGAMDTADAAVSCRPNPGGDPVVSG